MLMMNIKGCQPGCEGMHCRISAPQTSALRQRHFEVKICSPCHLGAKNMNSLETTFDNKIFQNEIITSCLNRRRADALK